jgi:hypothetical protein
VRHRRFERFRYGFAAPFGLLTAMAATQAAIGTRLGPAYRGMVR